MCGIIGVLLKNQTLKLNDIYFEENKDNKQNKQNSVNNDGLAYNRVLDILKSLEYRGYDSAGVAILDNEKKILVEKSIGEIDNLKEKVDKNKSFNINCNNIAIGHTRWATHGEVNLINCHPHFTEKVAVVHNGVIENYKELKEELQKEGISFNSQTDTEVISNLITYFLQKGFGIKEALKEALVKVKGSYSICVIFSGENNIIAFAKHNSSLVIGKDKDDDFYVCSELNAINDYVNSYYVVNDGEYGFATINNGLLEVELYDLKLTNNNNNIVIKPQFLKIEGNIKNETSGNFSSFMMKEIEEQPEIIEKLIEKHFDVKKHRFVFNTGKLTLKRIKEINIVACGTSYNAGFIAKYYFEKYANINVNLHIASEFLYGSFNFKKGGVFLFISQSGETADTISCLKLAKQHKQHILSLVNVKNTTIDRLADCSFYCEAGAEIGVASTKCFTSQLLILTMFALHCATKKGNLKKMEISALYRIIKDIPNNIREVLKKSDNIKNISNSIADSENIITIGRNVSYGLSLECALKIKEISYIPVDAVSAGELKHGTLALVDEKTPVIVFAIPDFTFVKTISNTEEILSRKGKVILISNKKSTDLFKDRLFSSIDVKDDNYLTATISYAIVLQLLALFIAEKKGHNVDKPRNLAKSVTVE